MWFDDSNPEEPAYRFSFKERQDILEHLPDDQDLQMDALDQIETAAGWYVLDKQEWAWLHEQPPPSRDRSRRAHLLHQIAEKAEELAALIRDLPAPVDDRLEAKHLDRFLRAHLSPADRASNGCRDSVPKYPGEFHRSPEEEAEEIAEAAREAQGKLPNRPKHRFVARLATIWLRTSTTRPTRTVHPADALGSGEGGRFREFVESIFRYVDPDSPPPDAAIRRVVTQGRRRMRVWEKLRSGKIGSLATQELARRTFPPIT